MMDFNEIPIDTEELERNMKDRDFPRAIWVDEEGDWFLSENRGCAPIREKYIRADTVSQAIEPISFVKWEKNGVILKTRHHEFIVTTPPYDNADTVPQWQPIESAPMNDDFIIVAGGSYSCENTGAEFYAMPFDGVAVVSWNRYENQWIGCDCDNMIYQPTHWIPLPKPPGEKK